MSTLEVVEGDALPSGVPSWARARTLWRQAQQRAAASADSLHQLAAELLALRRDYVSKGGRPGNSSARGRVFSDEANPSEIAPQPAVQFPSTHSDIRGWQEKVREELGISHQQAIRLIERSRYVRMLEEVAQEQPFKLGDGSGNFRVIEPTPEMAEIARKAIPAVLVGEIAASRAWAGVMGEGSRRGDPELGRHRAPVDHGAVMLRALRSLRAGVASWESIDPQTRAAIELEWQELLAIKPSTWAGGVVGKVGGRG